MDILLESAANVFGNPLEFGSIPRPFAQRNYSYVVPHGIANSHVHYYSKLAFSHSRESPRHFLAMMKVIHSSCVNDSVAFSNAVVYFMEGNRY